jgi:hypothetical protein
MEDLIRLVKGFRRALTEMLTAVRPNILPKIVGIALL